MSKLLRNVLLVLAGVGFWQWQRQQRYANQQSIKNKVIIITGASSGIGQAAARLFAAQGAHVVPVARRTERLEELKTQLEAEYGSQILPITADLTRSDDIQRVVDETIAHFGRIDVLVNNAGLTHGGPLDDQDPEIIAKMIQLNLHSVINLTRLVIPVMKKQRSGQIVNVSSMSGATISPGFAPYASTKAGLNHFTRILRRELASSGIGVSLVMPGWTQTDMIDRMTLDKFPGVREGITEIQSPEYVASHIVAAVRYNTRAVMLGGIGFTIMALTERILPSLAEWLYFNIYEQAGYADALRDIG